MEPQTSQPVQAAPPPKPSKHFVPTHEKHITVTFSLSPALISRINKECGYERGKRSEWAEKVFRKALDI